MGHPGTSHGDQSSRTNAEFAPSAAQGIEVVRSCWLGPEAEDKVLRLGLLAMREALGTEGLLEFPRRPNGAPRLMRQGFFERLLREQTTLKECAAADISAAGADIRHLALTQLLAIRCMSFDFAVRHSNQQQASFISLIDRWTMTSIAQRLLGDEVLPDAHCSVVIRHAVLIYGANRQLTAKETSAGCDWWLLAVGGTRRYLNLPRCEMSSCVPQGHVYCYRSHSAADPRDPRRSRVFRWQALLVATPASWTEDPLSFEQRSKKRHELRDVVTKPAAPCAEQGTQDSAAAPSEAFGLFDTNFGNLCDQAERELDELFGDVVLHSDGQDVGEKSGVDPAGKTEAPCEKQASPVKNLCMQAELELDALFDSVNAAHDRTGNSVSAEESAAQPGPAPNVTDTSSDCVLGDDGISGESHKLRPNVDEMFDSFMSELDQLGSSPLDHKPPNAGAAIAAASEGGDQSAWSSSAAAAIDDFCGSLLDASVDHRTAAQGRSDGDNGISKPCDSSIEGDEADIAKCGTSTSAEAVGGVEASEQQTQEAEQVANSHHGAPGALKDSSANKAHIWESKWLILLVLLLAFVAAAVLRRAN